MPADPGVHRDCRRGARIDRPRRPELGDREHGAARGTGLLGEPLSLLPEEQDALAGQVEGLERHGSGQVVDADERHPRRRAPSRQLPGVCVVANMLVPVGHHRAAPVPAAPSNDVNLRRHERVRRAHDGADVEVVGEVLDRDMEAVPAPVEILDDGLEQPVPVLVDHVSAVTGGEQFRVEPGLGRPRLGMRPHADRHVTDFHPGDDSLNGMHALTTVVDALGPDPEALLRSFGAVAFWVVLGIIFAECGLLIGFFLPGDSLLFITGMLIAQGFIAFNIWGAVALLIAVAILGNVVGYWIGHKVGPAMFRKPDSKLFKREYVDKTHAFFEKYGARAIVLARFVPIVRTFITAIAGVGRMDFGRFLTFSAIGAVLWAGLVTLAGYFLGNIEFVKKNVEIILILVVVVSILPIIIEVIKHRRERSRA